MTDFPDSRITKQKLSEHFSVSLSTTRRTLKAIGADLSFRTYDLKTLERFALARHLFKKRWSEEMVKQFFNHMDTTRDISNQ